MPTAFETARHEDGDYVLRFAASADPNGRPTIAWPRYIESQDPYLEFADAPLAKMGLHSVDCDLGCDGASPMNVRHRCDSGDARRSLTKPVAGNGSDSGQANCHSGSINSLR